MSAAYGQKEARLVPSSTRSRRRQIVMKEKCNYMNHSISLNLQKLDQLLKIVRGKKQQIVLNTIQQQVSEQLCTIQARQKPFSQYNQKDKKKQRRLKFKYSIYREYQFQQNQTNQQNAQAELKNTYIQQDHIIVQGQKDEFLLQIGDFNNNSNQNSLLEKSYLLSSSRSRTSKNKVKGANSVEKSQFEFTSNPTKSIKVETRYNWIDQYLDHDLNDTVVRGINEQSNQIQVLKFSSNTNILHAKLVQSQNQRFKGIKDSNNFSQILTPKKAINQKTSINLSDRYFDCQYNDFVGQNSQISIEFPRHTNQVKILSCQERQKVIRLKLSDQSGSIRVLVNNQNKNQTNMQRIMIVQQIPQSQHNEEKYRIVWTRYQKSSFIEDVILQAGTSYLITNMCNSPSSDISLVFNSVDLPDIRLQTTSYDPWRSYNMLCSSFQQCSKVFMSHNIFDDLKPLEFLRANFLDYGLVLQVYQNIYSEKVAFLENKQDEAKKVQDKSLLFPELYTKHQHVNVYLPDQLVIKFFEVTQKPARLYFPQKKVLIGDKMAELTTIHSTFK